MHIPGLADALPFGADSATPGGQPARMQELAYWLFSLSLAMGVVYRLPGISADVVRLLKPILIVPAAGLVFARALSAGRRPFPAGLLGPAGFAALAVLWIPGLARAASVTDAVDLMVDLTVSAAVFWCAYCIAVDNRREGASNAVWLVLRRAFAAACVVAGVSLVHEAGSSGVWSAGPWRDRSFGGFGLGSSGWSVGLALFLPLAALFWTAHGNRRPAGLKFLAIAGAAVLLAGQFLSAGLSGILASTVTLGALAWRSSRRLALGIVVTVSAWIVLFCLGRSCSGALGFSEYVPWGDPATMVCTADQLTTRRLAGHYIAVEQLAETPFVGLGFGGFLLSSPDGVSIEVHNLWLRWALYTGILAPLLLAAIAARLMHIGWRAAHDPARSVEVRHGISVLMLVLLAGLIVSQFEPSVPIGTTVSLVWWAAAGALVGIATGGSGTSTPPASMREFGTSG